MPPRLPHSEFWYWQPQSSGCRAQRLEPERVRIFLVLYAVLLPFWQLHPHERRRSGTQAMGYRVTCGRRFPAEPQLDRRLLRRQLQASKLDKFLTVTAAAGAYDGVGTSVIRLACAFHSKKRHENRQCVVTTVNRDPDTK